MTDTIDSHPAPTDNTPVPYARFTRRVQALSLDALLYFGAFIIMVLGASLVESTALGQRLFFGSLVTAMVLYEPVLVAWQGGTLGHRWTNLRVVSNKSGENLGFARAFARFVLKSVLGWLSFLTMTFTRRHQAIHDLATGSHVQVRELRIAVPEHYVVERPPVQVGILRRLGVIVAYNVLLFLGVLAFLATAGQLISDACWDADVCTGGEEAVLAALAITWLVLVVVIIALGWRGRLPGARKPAA